MATFLSPLASSNRSRGVVDLQAAINRFVLDHNQQPKPFTWTAEPDKIIAAAARGHQCVGFNPLDAGSLATRIIQ
jgi:hypothetical protein